MASTTVRSKQMAPVDEAEAELVRNFGEHQLMGRVQEVLKQQLTTNLLRIEAELRQQEEAREAAKRQREDLGVELYGVQQQLARIQVDLDNKTRNVQALQDVRSTKESELRRFQDSFASRKAQVEVQQSKLEKFKGELDGVLDTIRQVEKYNEEMGNEIALTRRATHKAEEETQSKEKVKAAQDLYIDNLAAQVKRMADQLALLQSQIDAQKSETSQAAATMAEATKEMETIRFEKQQLLLQWQSSLVAMRRRDEVLTASNKAIAEAQESIDAMDAEEGNIRKALNAAQAAHARLQDTLDKEVADLKFLEGQVGLLRRQFEALEEREEQLAGTLEATDGEVKRVLVEQTKLQRTIREVDYQRYIVEKQRFALEDEISEALNGKITNEKASKAMVKDASRLAERMHTLDMSRAETENAIAAAKVEALNISSHLAALKDARRSAESNLQEKEGLIAQYESEIKQRHDAIDKKMAIVDRLNRKWEKMIAGAPEAENMGPLHAEVHNLKKQIAAVKESSEALQRRWLTDQTSLVAATNEAEVKTTKLREASSQAVLLNQKRIRLDAAIENHKSELKRLEVGIKTMHDDMARINALIAKNEQLTKRLAAATYTSERAFTEELRDMEREAAQQDARIASLRDERHRLLADLVECERQVILWEKKIAIEKETQEALDPSVGESEISNMEKEINRMRNRFDAMKRDQERLVAEMERAIEKRDVIAMKHRSARQLTMEAAAAQAKGMMMASTGTLKGSITSSSGAKATEGGALTRVGLQHRATALRKDINTKLSQAEEVESQLAGRMEAARGLSEVVQQRSSEMQQLEERSLELQRSINVGLYEKQKAIERMQGILRMLQRFEALDSGRMPGLTSDEAAHVRDRLREAEMARNAIRAIIDRLAQQHGELAEILDRVAQLMDTAPS